MTDVIRRKIDSARPAPSEGTTGAPGADRGWRLALARAARDAIGLELDLTRLTIARHGLAELLDMAPERPLIALLDGPRGGLGVLMLDGAVTSTWIEMQTLGRISSAALVPRKPTRIDAAMVAGLIDRALANLDDALAEEDDLTWAGGFRYASFLEDVRPLGLLLEDDAYRVLSAEVVMGAGQRQGRILLILPAQGRGERPLTLGEPVEGEAPQFSAALSAQIMQAECRLDAVIGRLTMPIRQIMALQVDELLPLLQTTVHSVTLETLDGRRVATGKLGQNRGMRAIRLADAADLATEIPPMRREDTPLSSPAPPSEEMRAAG